MRHGGRTGKVWFFRYRDNQGMEKEKRVGTYPDMSLVDARKQVQDLRERRVSGKPLVGTFTFTVADLCEKFIEEHAHGTKSNAEPVTTSLRGISIDQASTLTTLPWSVLPMTGSMRMPSTGQPFS